MIQPGSFSSKESDLNYKIYWSKAQVLSVWSKLKTVKNKVNAKRENDYIFIIKAIEHNQEEYILSTLRNPEFKKFYCNKDALFPQNDFFESLIKNRKFNLVTEVLKDKSYKFDDNYIFTFMQTLLAPIKTEHTIDKSNDAKSQKESNIEQKKTKNITKKFSFAPNPKQKEILYNLIYYNLYPKCQKKIEIIIWFLSALSYYDIFRLIAKRINYIDMIKKGYNDFETEEDISSYAKINENFQKIIKNCIELDLEDLAICFCDFYPDTVDNVEDIAVLAAETQSMKLLQHLWENERFRPYNTSTVSGRRKTIFQKSQYTYNIEFIIKTISSSATTNQERAKSNANISKILEWENIEKAPKLVESLFRCHCFEQIGILISRMPPEVFSKGEYFKKVIQEKQTELLLFFLSRKECWSVLEEHNVQEFIVNEYISNGDTFYYGAEMLKYIYKEHWKSDLTKVLCKKVIKTIKTKDILNCHSPILSCLLIYEFLNDIKEISIMNLSRCLKIQNELILFCSGLQESNQNEVYVGYLMKQKDTRGRNVFQIVSENELYKLLESPEIGIIVQKMWDGSLSNNSLVSASSLHKYLFELDQKANDPLILFAILNKTRFFFFRLQSWLGSCSLRFKLVIFFSVMKVVIYSLYIFLLNDKGELLNSYEENSGSVKILIIVYLILTNCQMFDLINRRIFFFLSNRTIPFHWWNYVDVLMFIFSWMILVDTKRLFSEYKQLNPLNKLFHDLLWDVQIPFTKEVDSEIDYYSSSASYIFRVCVLSINSLLVWLRVVSVLLTYKQFGPVIVIIIKMGKLLMKFFIIIIIFLVVTATMFKVIFCRFSDQFDTLPESIITLFGAFLNDFNALGFDEQYQGIGSALFMAYASVTSVLFVGLLIAMLGGVYEGMVRAVDASHRSVLMQFYRQNKWDKNYGYMILLSPPLSIINIIAFICRIFVRCDKKKFNIIVTRIYYLLLFFPLLLIPFMIYTLILIPFVYIKGIIMIIEYEHSLKISTIKKIFITLSRIACGLLYLSYIWFRDIILCCSSIFNEVPTKISEYRRVKSNMTYDDVVIFLKFIHSVDDTERNIHSLFLMYLEYEKECKSQMKAQVINAATYTKYIRKNLMILELLENFVIEDEFSSFIDIPRMRKLLPLTMNIKKDHLRRLMHSNANAFQQTMTKMKKMESIFLQYQILKSIISIAQKLDKDIDSDIYRIRVKSNYDERITQADKIKAMNAFNNFLGGLSYTVGNILDLLKERDKDLQSSMSFRSSKNTVSLSKEKGSFISTSCNPNNLIGTCNFTSNSIANTIY